VAALAIVLVTYPVVFTVLRAISEGRHRLGLTFEWLAAAVRSPRAARRCSTPSIYTAGSSALAMLLGVGLAFLATAPTCRAAASSACWR
jgi:ABC-type Fe3+ transport system permease subunit